MVIVMRNFTYVTLGCPYDISIFDANHDQTERAFQKQPTVFHAKKGGLKKSESRWFTNPGLGFKVPREVRLFRDSVRKVGPV